LPFGGRNALSVPDVAVGSVSRYLGILASVLECWDVASDHFEDALEMNRRMGASPWVAHTEFDYARMLVARGGAGDRQGASVLLRLSLEISQELGLAALSGDLGALLDARR
jgi:hypothetical protein